MKYPINKEFGLYAHLHPPVYAALLPLVNFTLAHLPRGKCKGVRESKLVIPSEAGGSVSALLFTPEGAGDASPLIVYLHGGAFVMEAAPSHYALAREYALGAHSRVLLVQYRLAPAHAFPVPLLDCFSAYRYALDNAEQLSIDPRRVAVCGDSAGGCLACGVCTLARERGVPLPCFELLVYPVLDRRMQTGSMKKYTDTPMWNARLNAKMWRWYLKDAPEASPAGASPAEDSLTCNSIAFMPDAYIETAEFDCLRDEGVAYAEALTRAGVTVELNNTRGTMHGFDAALKSPTVRECVRRRVETLRRAFGV